MFGPLVGHNEPTFTRTAEGDLRSTMSSSSTTRPGRSATQDASGCTCNGASYFTRSHFLLDRFHLARALRRALPEIASSATAINRGSKAFQLVQVIRMSSSRATGFSLLTASRCSRGLTRIRAGRPSSSSRRIRG
jgi:hypothetical protein